MVEPTLVFDDDCGFCTWWAEFFDDRTDVRIVGFTDLTPELRARLPDDYEDCSHLVTDEAVYSCGQSLEEGVARIGDEYGVTRDAVDFLRNFQDYERLRERGYRQVAANRDFWGQFLSKTPPVRRRESERNC
jgi:predicted DCC family thiol-disulfide oxidoreductase YuxK